MKKRKVNWTRFLLSLVIFAVLFVIPVIPVCYYGDTLTVEDCWATPLYLLLMYDVFLHYSINLFTKILILAGVFLISYLLSSFLYWIVRKMKRKSIK